jgi:riboflavin kinase/FMN adenylyltransferase
MRVLRDEPGAPAPPRGGVVTIGNYDGLHLGQRAILERVVARARELGPPSLAITFDPHPLRLLDPARAPVRLTPDAQRERLLAALGLDVLWVVPFTLELAAQPAHEFVRERLVGRLALREIHVGSRFAFGRGREGDLDLLRRLGRELGFAAHGVPEVERGGAPVSATRIRALVASGRTEEAAALLGRPFTVTGEVVHGDRAGTRLGFPTINLATDHELLPADGVYATRVALPDGSIRDAVSNVGVRPTLHAGGGRVVESHLLDFAGDLYGAAVEVGFLARLREERKFPGIEALREQIAIDAAAAREYFGGRERFDGRTAPDGASPATGAGS